MKILQIRFRNLNSLVGEWQIDLTDPAYVADGIFAITGPTGAGKSTILDAICLALYGRTPRLGKVSASDNEIMSRQTGECFAEVTFETVAGRYRCHWSQRRAHRKSDGELQPQKQEIAKADTGEIIESMLSKVAAHVEQVTGMSFDRFTRSMLLAQGGFAAFLQASANERAPILEQITGTEIYSEISIRVHERQRAEKQQLELLQAETSGITLLDPEQEQQIRDQLEVRKQEEAELGSQLVNTQQAITWLGTIDNLNRELSVLAEEAGKLKTESDAFVPQRQRLGLALKAATLEGRYAALTTTRKQLQQDREALSREQHALPALEKSALEQAEALKAVEQHCTQSRQRLTDAAPLLQQVRSLDQTLADQTRTISVEQQACDQETDAIKTLCKQRATEQQKQNKATERLQRVQQYLQQHARDEWLVSGLAGVREQLESLLDRQRDIARRQNEQSNAEKNVLQANSTLETLREQYTRHKQEREQAGTHTQQAREALSQLLQGKLLREWRAEKDSLQREAFLLSRIAQLEDQRNRLEDGQPCPLCGATEHPFAHGNVPTPDAAERQIAELDKLIAQAEEQESHIRRLEQAELQAHTLFANTEAAGKTANHEAQSAETRLAEIKSALQALQADFERRQQTVAAGLLPLGISAVPDGAITGLLEDLDSRLKAWQSHAASKLEIDRQLAELASEVRRLDALIEAASGALANRTQHLELLRKNQAEQAERRRELFDIRDPAAEEHRLQQAIGAAEEAEKAARMLHAELHQRWSELRVHVDSLQQRIARCEPELAQMEAGFSSALAGVGFVDETACLAAVLSDAERNELAAHARALDERQAELKTRQMDRQARLAAEQTRSLTAQTLEQLQAQQGDQDAALRELRQVCGALRHQLQENTSAAERLREKQQGIEAQQMECRRWDALHMLIGSSDGKKYRNFAQGLTFEMMIGHANRQLQKMTDRYLLIRDRHQPLELNVLDNYQAGEVRSTRNLSGGESFIVSLALALGLSQMSSRNVRVDSLFLDEGFGTLDEEALDTALDTLAGLQQDGKLIGIISHVQALKERISTRIMVEPQTGGRSRIVGPGCMQL
ncbi:MAG: AAA family ATPase [Pseudomonas sp.]